MHILDVDYVVLVIFAFSGAEYDDVLMTKDKSND